MSTKAPVNARRGRRLAGAFAIALILAGCVNPAFRQSAGQFGTVAKASVADQNQRLAALVAAEQERIRANLAANHVDLRLDPGCAAAVIADPTAGPAPICRLVRADGQPLEAPPPTDDIVALGAALTGYADNLIALAADTTQDRQAFTTSVNNLATSLGTLEGAFRKAAQAVGNGTPSSRPDNSAQRLGAVAAVVAQAGNLYFAYRRAHVLKRIVTEADPIVQQAVALLGQTQARIALFDRAGLFAQVQDAQRRASQLAASGASPADLRTAQNQLYDRLAAFNGYGAGLPSFQAIGEAHHKLALAARSTSPAAMAEAIKAILDLAGTVYNSARTLSGDSGSR